MSGPTSPLRLPPEPPPARRITERPAGEFPLFLHPEWHEHWPWLVQGTTGRGPDGFDLGLFGEVPVGVAHARWRRLREHTGLPAAIHAHQVHGARVLWHERACGGLLLLDDADGHATTTAGLLLTVSVADCVPIFLVAPERRAIALLHGGWRGVAAGILEQGIAALAAHAGCQPGQLHLHCGPAICGDCYQVSTEVAEAVLDGTGRAGRSDTEGDVLRPHPSAAAGAGADRRVLFDLRSAIAHQAVELGIPAERITLSSHCTRCGEPEFWSHRGGCRERQMGVLGLRPL